MAAMETTHARPGAPPRRRFRLSDAILLVAATAAGLAVVRAIDGATGGDVSWSAVRETWDEHAPASESGRSRAEWLDVLSESGVLAAGVAAPLAAALTLGLIPLRLIGPRPRFRALTRQPGLLVALSAAVVPGVLAFPCLVVASVTETESMQTFFFDYAFVLAFTPLIGLAVLISWMPLIVGRRWRAERSWLDRLGRALGAYWIASGLIVATGFVYVVAVPQPCFSVRRVQAIEVPIDDGSGNGATEPGAGGP